ncbi:hypothetical protein HW555_002096, partial [Spodoptera exigua]
TDFFSNDPLYYRPFFQHVISGRRFEEVIRCLCVADDQAKGERKVLDFIKTLNNNFQLIYGPSKELSTDESLILFRGRIFFRQYIKSKKARYGIKFYVLTTASGYILDMIMYRGKYASAETGKKTQNIVLKLLEPYVFKGHHVFMDNFYNSVELSQKLFDLRRLYCGTLRKNRKGNPRVLTSLKLKKGDYYWYRKGQIYVSIWRDKRPELLIIEKGKKSGSGTHEIYKPSIKWFDSMDYIMKIINLKEKETLSNLEPNHASTSGNEDLDASDNRNKAVPTKVVRPPKTPKLKTKVSSERSEIQAAVNELKELNISLLNVSAPIPRELEDECDVIGRHVALQLKQLPPIDRIDATDEIQAILSRYRKSTRCARIMLIILYTPSDYSSECTPSKQPAANYQLVGPTISAHSTQLEQSSPSILHNGCTLLSQPVVFAAPYTGAVAVFCEASSLHSVTVRGDYWLLSYEYMGTVAVYCHISCSHCALIFYKMNDRDIEQYLASLEGGWLSEDDIEESDQEEEQVPEHYNREQVLNMLESDEEDTENPNDPEGDPPLVENEVIDIQNNDIRIPSGHTFTGLLDKRKLIWKKRSMEFDESKIKFQGSSDLGPELSELDTPYACFNYFFTEDFMKTIVEQTNLYATQQNPGKGTAFNLTDLRMFFGVLMYMSVQHFPILFIFLCQQPNRASKIIALVPNEHAPSDASENSESETEMHDDPRAYASSPLSSSAPSITSSLANLTISTSEDEEPNIDNNDVIPDSIVREIGESNYENVPSLSAIPSLPSTPMVPIAFSSPLSSRNTRSRKQASTVPAKKAKKGKKFQLSYKWKVAQFRHRATVEEDENGEYINLPEDVDSPLNKFILNVQQTAKSIQLSEEEFKDFLAIHIIMGIVVMPSYLDYWSDKFRYAKVGDIMSLKRYQQVRRYLHFVDNNMDDGDKYYKVRPVVEQIRQNCLKQQKKVTKFSIDEMMIASFVASEPVEKIRRYCKDAKCKIDVQCPQIVRQYNKHMGGVDLADMLISLYKTPFKSRRWYLAIFSQMLDICVNNAWLLYRRKHSSNAKGKIPLKAFRYEIYETLLKANRCAKRSKTETAKVSKPHVARPSSPVKYDNIGHFPSTMEEGRCRYCQKKSVVYCIKYNTRLCFRTTVRRSGCEDMKK